MKQIAFLLATTAALSACSGTNGTSLSLGIGGFGRHLGLGTSVNIPIGGKTALPYAADAGEKTVAHFSADGKPPAAPCLTPTPIPTTAAAPSMPAAANC